MSSVRVTSTNSTIFEFDFSDGRSGGEASAPLFLAESQGKPAAAVSNPAKPKPRGIELVPWTVVIDTREQLPYSFDGMIGGKGGDKTLVVRTVCESPGLPSGDYSIQGFESEIAIERKSLQDLYGSCIQGRERFENEIARLSELPGFAAVVIEATWEEINDPTKQDPCWMSRVVPASVVGTIWSWSIRYPRVHWWPAGTRRGAEEWTFMMLGRFWTEQEKKRKEVKPS